MLYVDGLMSAEGGAVPFSPDVKRSHLVVSPGKPISWQVAHGAETVRRDFANERLLTKRNMRVTVDVERGSVVLLWESAMDNEHARVITIVDRFLIVDGQICEIEIISIPQAQSFGEVPYAGWAQMIGETEA